ncbi:MAG: DGQHR domain-containing protein [Candidatus Thermoplasmatota archaeon]|nr:DGQHR domain-containing protein [Candidatus Thermoplasmatota archaeon]
MDGTEQTVNLNVVKTRQGVNEFYVGAISSSILCGEWGRKHIRADMWSSGNQEGYQRTVTDARVKDFANYIGNNRMSPTGILLNSRDGNIDFKPYPGALDYGKLTIPASSELYEVDGQHRIEGLRMAYESKKAQGVTWTFEFPVVITRLSKYEEAVQFAVINKTQKGLRTELTDRVLRKISEAEDPFMRQSLPRIIAKDIEWRSVASKIVDGLKQQGIWSGKIQIPNTKRSKGVVVSEGTIVSSLEPLVKRFDLTDSNIPHAVEILASYWEGIAGLCPNAVTADAGNFPLMKSLGVGVMHTLLLDVIDISDDYHAGSREPAVFREILEAAGDKMTDKFWEDAKLFGNNKGSVSRVYRLLKEPILSFYSDKNKVKQGRVL